MNSPLVSAPAPTTQIILCQDCTTISLDYIRSFADVMITDPPFSEYVHKHAVSASASGGVNLRGVEERLFGFDPLDDRTRAWLMSVAGVVRRWSLIYSDIESTHRLREFATMPHELSDTKRVKLGRPLYVRTLPWIRWSAPQLHGGCPPSGREDLVVFHGLDGHPRHLMPLYGDDPGDDCFDDCEEYAGAVLDLALFWGSGGGRSWNGPGNLTHLNHPCMRAGAGKRKHKAQKSLFQALDLVSWFSNPGEWVVDWFSGSGTVALACALLGRNFFGTEFNAKDPEQYWFHWSKRRLVDELDARDAADVERFLGPREQGAGAPGDTETGPTGVRRAEARSRDRAIILAEPRVSKLVASAKIKVAT